MNSPAPIRVVDLDRRRRPRSDLPWPCSGACSSPIPSIPAAGAPAPGPVPRRPGDASAAPSLPGALRDIEGVRARLDGMLAEARRGRTFSPQELLCLQADAHRFAQTVEFAARAVEHGVQGLRQALNAQV